MMEQMLKVTDNMQYENYVGSMLCHLLQIFQGQSEENKTKCCHFVNM
jgi:hypothetical protein